VTASGPLSGTVALYNFGNLIAIGLPVTNGQTQMNQGYVNTPGVFQLTAAYSGDVNNLASTSTPLIQVITGTMPAIIEANTGGDYHTFQAAVGVQ
jgi:hypothetical protein